MHKLTALLIALALPSPAIGQFTTWHQSGGRPGYWLARRMVPTTWTAHRFWRDVTFPDLPLDLASIESLDEYWHVLNSFISGFVGLHDFVNEGTYEWIDGTPGGGPPFGPIVGNSQAADFGWADSILTRIEMREASEISIAWFGLFSPDCDADGEPDLWQIELDPGLDQNGNGIIDTCESVGVNYCTASVNSSGSTGTISAWGDPRVSENLLVLQASGLPPSEWGYFLMSDTPAFVPTFGGGDGNLCLGGSIIRLYEWPGSILNSGRTGEVSLHVDLPTIPQGISVKPGDTWRFQYWTRDIFTHNTSDGLAVTFQ